MTKPEAEVREAVTTEEKLAWLDQEVRYLQEYHLKQGLTPWQMETMAEPLLSVLGQTKQTNCKSLLIKCALVIGLVAGVVYYDPAYRFVCANGRLLSMKVRNIDYLQLSSRKELIQMHLFKLVLNF